MSHIRFAIAILSILLAGVVVGHGAPSLAVGATAEPTHAFSAATATLPQLEDAHDVEAFFDAQFDRQLAENHVAGAVVSLVRDGRIVFAKGYGQSDLSQGRPVVADRTLFRIGSVSKLFVATAVMQLVEEGKLDLNADVNSYLTSFKLQTRYPEPITLRHLLTHTAGFEESIDIFSTDASGLRPLDVKFNERFPMQVRPAGAVTSYSNHGVTLAALVVEQVSGQAFERYVDDHILAPLSMNRSSFAQPPPERLAGDVSQGYTWLNGRIEERPFEYVTVAPAGAMSATATDMAAFMIAHLQHGRFGAGRILQDRTAQEMQREQFTNDPRIDGMAVGFFRATMNGQRILGHDGDTFLFHSQVVLIPDQQTGIFISFNSTGGAKARAAVLRSFLDRYFPAAAANPAPIAPNEVPRVAGWYRPTRAAHSDITKIFTLFNTSAVSQRGDGSIDAMNSDGEMKHWIPTAPGVFQQEEGDEIRVFRLNNSGKVEYLLVGHVPVGAVLASEHVGWDASPTFHWALIGGSLAVLITGLLFWPIQGLYRILRRRTGSRERLPRFARVMAWSTAVVILLFVVGLVSSVSDMTRILGVLSSPLFKGILTLGLIAAVLAAGTAVCAIYAWGRGYWSLLARIHFTLFACAAVAFVVELSAWNFLGFRL